MSEESGNTQKAAEAWLERLRTNGCRITPARQAVVRLIAGSRRVISPQDVYELARSQGMEIGLVSVYRTVEKLEELGMIQRVHRPSGCHAFAPASAGHQHLLICEKCGQVEFFEGDRLDALIAAVGSDTGYQVSQHWLQLFGTCSDCRE